MTAPLELPVDDGIEPVELLTMVSELCAAFPVHLGDMLGSHLAAGYSSWDLRDDTARLARVLATAMGFQDASMDGVR